MNCLRLEFSLAVCLKFDDEKGGSLTTVSNGLGTPLRLGMWSDSQNFLPINILVIERLTERLHIFDA